MAGGNEGAVRYAPVPDEVRVERLEDLTLVFHRLSSETHILSPEMDAIFTQIPAGGDDVAGILRRLEAEHGAVEAEGGDAAGVIAARLEELAALGLVRREA